MEQRKEGFYESKIQELEVEVKSLSFDNAELVKSNDELTERVKTLASRQPTWPKGYRPQRRHTPKKNWTNNR